MWGTLANVAQRKLLELRPAVRVPFGVQVLRAQGGRVTGYREGWDGQEPFTLSPADGGITSTSSARPARARRRSCETCLYAGRGVWILDPHGDLAEDLLDHFPPWRAVDFVYFDPADHEPPVALNVLHAQSPERRHLVSSGIVEGLRSIWRDSCGPRLKYLLYATVAALGECENVSLLGIQRTSDATRGW